MSEVSVSKTPLDYIADGYWQDFVAHRPVAGGIAYETQLHACQLDLSLVSLQRLDTLLSQMRRELSKAGQLDEMRLLTQDPYRNLLLFLAFYAGQVLAAQWQHTPHWYGQFELRSRYPQLPLVSDDFYQHMAVVYKKVRAEETDGVFFALEPIGLRLFGNIDRQFEAVQGGAVAGGLYQAVIARLPAQSKLPAAGSDSVVMNMASTANKAPAPQRPLAKTDTTSASIQPTPQALTSSTNTPTTPAVDNQAAVNNAPAQKITATTPTILTKPTKPAESTPSAASSMPSAPPAANARLPTLEPYTQLLSDLNTIEMAQSAGKQDYQTAVRVLDQFEQHIAKQDKPRAQVVFSAAHQDARKKALVQLQRAADAGHTGAMLRLAMYELLDEGLNEDSAAANAAGVTRVKAAADKPDPRAQRFLSRLYYQGLGVTQDVNQGRYWLEQAAKNGHTEAAALVAQWQQAESLMATKRQEQSSVKRYQLLIGCVVVMALLLIIFV